MMGQLSECAICGATLPYANAGQLCDLHLGVGVLRVAVLRNDPRYSDFRAGYNHGKLMTCYRPQYESSMPPLIPLWVVLMDIDRRARLWLDGGDQGWGEGDAA